MSKYKPKKETKVTDTPGILLAHSEEEADFVESLCEENGISPLSFKV